MDQLRKGFRTHGFSLVEVLISLALGLVIATILMTLLSDMQQHSKVLMAMAETQHRVDQASVILESDIARSGDFGCRAIDAELSVTHPSISDFQSRGLIIYPASNAQTAHILPAASEKLRLPNSPIVAIEAIAPPFTEIPTGMVDPNQVVLERSYPVNKQEMVLTDCLHVDIFKTAHRSNRSTLQFLTPTEALSHDYVKNSVVGKFIHRMYFLGNTDEQDKAGKQIPALFMIDTYGSRQELVRGITHLSVTYTDKTAAAWQAPTEQTIFHQGDLLRLMLTARSDSSIDPHHFSAFELTRDLVIGLRQRT